MPDETDPPAPESHPLIDRYRESYRIAGATTGFGTLVKAFGWVSGVLALGYGVAASLSVFGPLRYVFVFGGFLAAALAVLVFYVVGTVVVAVGETLRASADTAVNTSPFLSDEQKAFTMS